MTQMQSLWQVQVQGRTSDLEHLARHFASTPFHVSKDGRDGGFLYESDSFATCQTSEEVLKLADDELLVLSGVLKMMRDLLNHYARVQCIDAVQQVGETSSFTFMKGSKFARKSAKLPLPLLTPTAT